MPEMLEILNLAEHKGQGISRAVTKLANYTRLLKYFPHFTRHLDKVVPMSRTKKR